MITRITIPVLMMFMFAALATTAEVVPTADLMEAAPLEDIERLELSAVDLAAAASEDAVREEEGLPPRFSEPEVVSLSPEEIGTWENLPDGNLLLWRLRIVVPGALSLNLGFDGFRLPEGGRLVLHPAEGRQTAREFTSYNNKDHGELWTPVVLTDDLVVELTLPTSMRHDYNLHLVQVGKGYRFFGEDRIYDFLACQNDVVCPEGDPWWAEINSVAVYMIRGTWICSGVMVNNTAQDGTPYFLTAKHCGITPSNALSMIVFWNFQSPICGQQTGGTFEDAQWGATLRGYYGPSDFCLVELEDMPDPAWNVTYSGWDRSDADALWAVGIHHPWANEKSISFENGPTTTTSNMGEEVPGNGTHIRVEDWDDGTTWFGSSGSPLYNQNHHIIGQCHSGYSECGLDLSDWYGRFSVSWVGGGSPGWRLSDFLDPLGLNPMTLDFYAPHVDDLHVAPPIGLESNGREGVGPISPLSQIYVLHNRGADAFDFEVIADVDWVDLTGSTSGSLAPGSTDTVTVSIGAAALDLEFGEYAGTVQFLNLTTGEGNTNRPVRLLVGYWAPYYSWNLDTDPGWSREGEWAFGEPDSLGGLQGGYPDPGSGYTGANVLGYNLQGDYTDNMPEYHLTTDAIDCSNLQSVRLRFQRWLNVALFPYDQASIHVSNDSLSWTTVWQNEWALNDLDWELVDYDIGQVADGQNSVYVRWTMGPTNESWTFSGWNIDDIEIFGLTPTGVAGGVQTPERTSLAIPAPNPFNPRTKIQFALDRTQQVRLAVFDLRGKQVAELADQTYAAGVHEHIWDGRDVQRRTMPSGTYIVRLETESGVEARKVMLIR